MKPRVVTGLLVSAAAIGVLITVVDLPDFGAVIRRIRPVMLLPFLALIATIALLLALRWKQLNGPALGYGSAVAASLVGAAGNMVLPLRGGDLLKVLRTSRGPSLPLPTSAASLVVEKALDLAVIAAIAVIAIGSLLRADGSQRTLEVLIIAGATLLLLVLGFILVRRQSDLLEKFSKRLLDRLGLGSLHCSLVQPMLARLGGEFSLLRLLALVGLTMTLHMLFYSSIYMYLGWLIGIELKYAEVLFILIAAAFGMTVPAAPSGIGVYHAAVASAFYAMGRPVSEGLAFGVTVHALSFAAFVVPGGIIWLVDVVHFIRRRRSTSEIA